MDSGAVETDSGTVQQIVSTEINTREPGLRLCVRLAHLKLPERSLLWVALLFQALKLMKEYKVVDLWDVWRLKRVSILGWVMLGLPEVHPEQRWQLAIFLSMPP
jgi:hypothetical protein